MAKIKICPRCLDIPNIKESRKMIYCQYCNTKLDTTKYSFDMSMQTDMKIISEYKSKPMFDLTSYRRTAKLRHQKLVQKFPDMFDDEQPTPTPTLTTCPVCQGKVSSAAPACPHCGQPMSGGQVAQPRPARVREPEDNTPRCPTCRSKNIRELTPLDRGLSLFAWGFASGKLGKSMICKNCGYKW